MALVFLLLFEMQDSPDVSEERISTLVQKLGSSDIAEREGAERDLRKIGAPAERALLGATRDPDPERSGRARAILASLRITKILADLHARVLDPENLEAEVTYSQGYGLRGLYRHGGGGKRFALTLERVAGSPPPRGCSLVSDGTTVWLTSNFGTQNGGKLYERYTAAGYEKRDLGPWSAYGFTLLPPPQVFRLIRLHVPLDRLREDSSSGGPVWILEGDVPREKRPALTYSGMRGSHTAQLTRDAEDAMLVRTVRLTVAKAEGGILRAEGLQRDGTAQWSLGLSNVKAVGPPPDALFHPEIPKGASVLRGD